MRTRDKSTPSPSPTLGSSERPASWQQADAIEAHPHVKSSRPPQLGVHPQASGEDAPIPTSQAGQAQLHAQRALLEYIGQKIDLHRRIVEAGPLPPGLLQAAGVASPDTRPGGQEGGEGPRRAPARVTALALSVDAVYWACEGTTLALAEGQEAGVVQARQKKDKNAADGGHGI